MLGVVALTSECGASNAWKRRSGRKVNPLHDRETNVMPKSSVGFGNFVVRPLFDLLHRFVTVASLVDPAVSAANTAHAIATIEANTKLYAVEAEKLEKAAKRSDATVDATVDKDKSPASSTETRDAGGQTTAAATTTSTATATETETSEANETPKQQ